MGDGPRKTAADAMTIVIADVEERDLSSVAAIERSAFSDPWSEKSFRDALAHPSIYFAAARDAEGMVRGYVVAWFVADEGQIANLAVTPEAWGSGIGRALLDAALREAALREAEHVYLEVRDSNERARALYRSRGFEEVGRRRGYYRRPVEDAIVLRRKVDGGLRVEG
jgi:ribosomal-protein-alanine N-acetyltransferase